MRSPSVISLALLALIPVLLLGCATYPLKLREPLALIRQGQPARAAELMAPFAQQSGDDQVVYLFEYGTALQIGRDYNQSNKALLQAEDLTAIKDYHSLSRITGSLLLNEGMVQYKGEDYEKIYLNAMLATNFLMLGNLEAAQVETRKLNDKLYKYRFEAKRDYNQDPFAFYLSALIWEQSRSWDDAYIDFKKTYELNPSLSYLKEDLVRASRQARRRDELEKWQREFPGVKGNVDKSGGELVLLYQQGWAPRKVPRPESPRFPKLVPVVSRTQQAKLIVSGRAEELSQIVTNVEAIAIKTLDDGYGALVAKRAAGIATKAVVSDQIRQKNELLGELAWIGMNLADQADLRQWSTLPQTFQIAKVRLPPGEYSVHVQGLTELGVPSGEVSEVSQVSIRKGNKSFIFWRSIQ